MTTNWQRGARVNRRLS